MAIFQRKDRPSDPRWWISYRDATGKWRREAIGTSKKLARDVLYKRKAETAEGRHFPNRHRPRLRFSQMLDLYWDLHARHKPSAMVSTIFYLKQIRAEFGAGMLDAVTVDDIVRYLNAVRARTSAATANRHHNILRSIFNRAIEWEKFDGPNPAAKFKQFRVENHRDRFLSTEEIMNLLDACSDDFRPAVLCALHTGMRRQEIIDLEWENVDLAHDTIHILRSKSGKRREIPITSTLATTLLELRPEQGGSVFGLTAPRLIRGFKKALKKAKIVDFRFHDLRHTFASHFVMRTSDLPALQRILGHASPLMTARYAHLGQGHLRVGMQLLDSGYSTKHSTKPRPQVRAL